MADERRVEVTQVCGQVLVLVYADDAITTVFTPSEIRTVLMDYIVGGVLDGGLSVDQIDGRDKAAIEAMAILMSQIESGWDEVTVPGTWNEALIEVGLR